VGTPAASDLTLAPGAGHGEAGDAPQQGPAQEETLPASPKPTNAKTETADATLGSVIELAARITKPEVVEANTREFFDLVTVRAKPEKRLNAKDRAKARRAKDKSEGAEGGAVAPATANPEATSLSTAHPKPEKRKNAKERAKEKYAKKDAEKETEDGTRPMTAKAKSKVESKAKKTRPR
jgi:hypothetical protein